MEPITKISHIPASRWALSCNLCKECTGTCIQVQGPSPRTCPGTPAEVSCVEGHIVNVPVSSVPHPLLTAPSEFLSEHYLYSSCFWGASKDSKAAPLSWGPPGLAWPMGMPLSNSFHSSYRDKPTTIPKSAEHSSPLSPRGYIYLPIAHA